MTLRFQRLLIILISIIMILGAVLLILYNARENISYYSGGKETGTHRHFSHF